MDDELPPPPWATLPSEQSRGPSDEAVSAAVDAAMRWRLVLGRHAEAPLPLAEQGDEQGSEREEALDDALEFLYDREFAQRSHREPGAGFGKGLSVPRWLDQVRTLFPREAATVLERDALQRYGLEELVTDPEVLERAEATPELLKAILTFKHRMSEPVLQQARRVVAEVVASLRSELEAECLPALTGARGDPRVPPARTYRNVDWHGTIRRNLDRYDPERQRLVPDRVRFRHRQRGRSPWRVVIVVDQSGSMLDSLIHASVMAAIFATMPSLTVHLVLFDHRVVDVSHLADDPLAVLMGSQLGGGTRIVPALRHAAGCVTEPRRTVFVVVSDFFLFGDGPQTLALAKELHESGIRCLGLCALDTDGRAVYDEAFARRLAAEGWIVAALTPKRLAEHVAGLIGT
jgi:Mg-chelatase subunit ChlD